LSDVDPARDADKPASGIHPFQLARRWHEEITHDANVTKAGIAKRESLSRARVTQIMNLLQLPQLIQQTLLSPPAPLKIDLFSERRLRALMAKGNAATKLRYWQTLLLELVDKALT
jgi:hypothetical protein